MSKIAVGIDIGTYQVKVVISQHQEGQQMPKIIGVGFSESKGLRHGYIINQTDAIRSIRKAIRQAEKNARVRVERAYISIGGIGLAVGLPPAVPRTTSNGLSESPSGDGTGAAEKLGEPGTSAIAPHLGHLAFLPTLESGVRSSELQVGHGNSIGT